MQQLSKAAFMAALAGHVTGTAITAAKAGSGTGSIFTLQLRTMVGGESYLMVYCAWKLLRAGSMACTWRDPEAELATALSALEGDRVLSTHLASGGDLVLTLSSGAELKLFADGYAQDALPDKYSACDYFVEGTTEIFSCIRGDFYGEEAKPPNEG